MAGSVLQFLEFSELLELSDFFGIFGSCGIFGTFRNSWNFEYSKKIRTMVGSVVELLEMSEFGIDISY